MSHRRSDIILLLLFGGSEAITDIADGVRVEASESSGWW